MNELEKIVAKNKYFSYWVYPNWLLVVKDLSEQNKVLVFGLLCIATLTGKEPDWGKYPKKIKPYYQALRNLSKLTKYTGKPKTKPKEEEDAGLRMIRQIEEEDRRKQNGY